MKKYIWNEFISSNKVGRDVVRNAAVLAPAQRKYREVQGAVWTLWSRLLDFHAFACRTEKRKFENAQKITGKTLSGITYGLINANSKNNGIEKSQ